jgi:hypothetical protein
MHKYELKFRPESSGTEEETRSFDSVDAAPAMHWAERKARGREFEIHEDGRRVSTARLSPNGRFWTLSK